MRAKSYWTTKDIQFIETVFPELRSRIQLDSLGQGRKADGCYVSNAAGKLRDQGEHELAELVERIQKEGC